MADPTYPLVNGTLHEWASVELKVKGEKFVGVKAINYDESVDPKKEYGASQDPIGETRGPRDANGDLEMYLEDFNRLLKLLGDGFYSTPFPITVAYSDDNVTTVVDELPYCKIKKISVSQSQGNDALTRKIELLVRKVLWDGTDGVPDPLG